MTKGAPRTATRASASPGSASSAGTTRGAARARAARAAAAPTSPASATTRTPVPTARAAGRTTTAPRSRRPPPPFVECDDSKVCGPGSHCQNGHCVTPPNGGPGLHGFPLPALRLRIAGGARRSARDARSPRELHHEGDAQEGSTSSLTGHCDARGEQEFNMSLGDNRAEAVKTFLVGLGVPATRITHLVAREARRRRAGRSGLGAGPPRRYRGEVPARACLPAFLRLRGLRERLRPLRHAEGLRRAEGAERRRSRSGPDGRERHRGA